MDALEQIKNEITSLYNDFYEKNEIDPKEGIWHNAPEGKKLRFATMPHIGEHYAEADKKILFVGLDIGMEEEKYIIPLKYRRDCFVHKITNCPNAHVSGMMITALFLQREKYTELWNEVLENRNLQNRAIVNKMRDSFPSYILDNVAQTNFYKFVTVGRTYRTGASDRQFFSNEQEKIEELFLKEVEILNPDIIWFQGKEFEGYSVYRELKKTSKKVIVSYHPSYIRACTPNYIIELTKDLEKQ
jgi:Uracil DNA glycosylase superfamily.